MTVFLIALPIVLILLGLVTIPEVLETWRVRSDLNYERFAQAYAEAVALKHQGKSHAPTAARFECYRDEQGYLDIGSMDPCDQYAFYDEAEAVQAGERA